MNKLLIPFILFSFSSCQEPTAEQQLSSLIEEFNEESAKRRSGGSSGGGGGSSGENLMDEVLSEKFEEISRLITEEDYETASELSKDTDSRELTRLLESGDYEAASDLLQDILRNLSNSSN